MKSLQFVITLALLVALVSMTAFAGGVKTQRVLNAQGNELLSIDRSKLESDIPATRAPKFGTQRTIDRATMYPEPVRLTTAALSKYPTVSAAGLSGTYTIPGDFPNLASAAAVLNFLGLDGDVTFVLGADDLTANPFVITGDYPNAGTYNVTIEPAAATAVTYDFVSTSTYGKGIALNGAKNVTIDGIGTGGASLALGMSSAGAFPTSDGFGATIYMTGAVDGISVLNTDITGQVDDPTWEDQTEGRSCVFIYSGSEDPDWNANVTFDNCSFTGATYGLKVLPYDFVVGMAHLTVNNCRFGSAYGDPLITASFIEMLYDVTWTNNTVDGVMYLQTYWYYFPTEYDEDEIFYGPGSSFLYYFGQMCGWMHILVDGGTYANNIIRNVRTNTDPGDGIIGYGNRTYGYPYLVNGDPVVMYNNRISDVFVDDPGGQINGQRGPGLTLYHNSVHLFGTLTYSATTRCLNGADVVYNNAFMNEMSGPGADYGTVVGGDMQGNAIYGTDAASNAGDVLATVAAGYNTNGVFGPTSFTWDMHSDSTAPTAAENIGIPEVLAENDIDGDSRDTAFAGIRDAGADEFPNTGSLLGIDVLPTSIVIPPAGGIPAGVPLTPTVRVKNNSPQATGSFNLNLKIAPDGYDEDISISLAPAESKDFEFPTYTPVGAATRTVTATTSLGGDIDATNDTISRSQPVSSPLAFTDDTLFTFDSGPEGWDGTVDWVLSSSFTKLGGPYGGSGASWVTESPLFPDRYTQGAYADTEGYGSTYPGANLLTSPWMDLTALGGDTVYISFSHGMRTEPDWDRGWMQYTLDGLTWTDLGTLNDPDGLNWYNEDLYENAALDPANWDNTTAEQYGVGTDSTPAASWNTNDDGNSPEGYVYSQLAIDATEYPGIVGGIVRFRFVAFSDAVYSPEPGGWTFDNFFIGNALPVFAGGTIAGHAWHDDNGNGVDDGETDYVGTTVYLSYLGVTFDSVVTDGSGDYSYTSGSFLPGIYLATLDVTGTAFSVPFGISNTGSATLVALADTGTIDFGTYLGSVSGKKFSDLNDNGADDSEPGLPDWTIELHKDSVNGPLVNSTVTDSVGLYSMLAPPYANYVLNEVDQASFARQTYPGGDGTHSFSVSGTSGGGGAVLTGKDFGNWVYAVIRVKLNVDINGNGIVDPADFLAVPSGATSDFRFIDETHTDTTVFTLGGGVIQATFDQLDLGTYDVEQINTIPGWVRTKDDSKVVVVNSSYVRDTAKYLTFKLITISGTKFDDTNGNGVQDSAEVGLEGWTINVSGGSYYGETSATTDSAGHYAIDSVFNGTHTVSEVAQSGWAATAPAGGSYAPFVGNSGNLITTDGYNFGNYADANVDGIVYRDWNGNGTMDPEDVPYVGATVKLAVNGDTVVSDGSGYEFTGLIATDTVRVNLPSGFVMTEPVAGEYPLALVSGGSAKGLNIGLFQTNDSIAKYRTFTADQLGADDQKKPGKAPKSTKPYDAVKNKPNTGNLTLRLLDPKNGLGLAAYVGLPGQLNAKGKDKAYWYPKKGKDVWKSLNNKSVHHTGMARGFDLTLKGKVLLKRQKSFPPGKKQDNHLFAQLAALEINLLSSGVTTPAGFGALIYNDPGSPLDGMTIDEIDAYADTVMTNWEFQPLGVYTMLDSVAEKINAAFATGATDDTLLGWSAFPDVKYPALTWVALTSVAEVPFLNANPGATPVNRWERRPDWAVPEDYVLYQNYPNPFNPTTTIEFDLPDVSIVTLKVYNMLGQEVATLVDHEEMDIGDAVEFDASSLSSGVYLYRIVAKTVADPEEGIEASTFTQVKKMMLIK